MKFLFDFFPILLFFGAYKLGDIYVATLVAIVASALQVMVLRAATGKYEKMPVITLGMLVILGGATLFFKNEMFIKWKPTVLYWATTVILALSHYFGQKPILQRLAGDNLSLPNKIWRQLNASWGFFFALMGALNVYVIYHFDTDFWVNFKLFGTLGATLVFVVIQAIYIAKHLPPNGTIR